MVYGNCTMKKKKKEKKKASSLDSGTYHTCIKNYLTLCLLSNFSWFLWSADFLPKSTFSKYNIFSGIPNTIRVSNSLDPDQARHFSLAWSGFKLFAKVSADGTSRQKSSMSMHSYLVEIAIFCLSLHLQPYFVCASREGSAESGQMPRLIFFFTNLI